MATELKSPPEPRTSRSERVVEDQINRIEKQIRWIDVGTGVFGLLVMLFAYGLIVILLIAFSRFRLWPGSSCLQGLLFLWGGGFTSGF